MILILLQSRPISFSSNPGKTPHEVGRLSASLPLPQHEVREPVRMTGRARLHTILLTSLLKADVKPLLVEPERRLAIGTDHALLITEIYTSSGSKQVKWNNDSRARWVHRALPPATLVDENDLQQLAETCTRPRFSNAYRDDAEMHDAIHAARETEPPRAPNFLVSLSMGSLLTSSATSSGRTLGWRSRMQGLNFCSIRTTSSRQRWGEGRRASKVREPWR